MKSEKSYIQHLKKLHFVEAVYRLWKQAGGKLDLSKYCPLAAASVAPQFYLAPTHALEIYAQYKNTGTTEAKKGMTQQMYVELFKRYEQLLAENDSKNTHLSKYSIMQDAIETQAPSFFIEPSYAVNFYFRAMAYKRTLSK